MDLGKKLPIKFSGEDVFVSERNNDIVITCRNIPLSFNKYKTYLKNPFEDNLSLIKKPCNIMILNEVVIIGCLRDSKTNFNKLINFINGNYCNETKNRKSKRSN